MGSKGVFVYVKNIYKIFLTKMIGMIWKYVDSKESWVTRNQDF